MLRMYSFLKFKIKDEAKNNCFKNYDHILCGQIVLIFLITIVKKRKRKRYYLVSYLLL